MPSGSKEGKQEHSLNELEERLWRKITNLNGHVANIEQAVGEGWAGW